MEEERSIFEALDIDLNELVDKLNSVDMEDSTDIEAVKKLNKKLLKKELATLIRIQYKAIVELSDIINQNHNEEVGKAYS